MSELIPDAKDLFERAKAGGFEPNAAQIDRVERALEQRLPAQPSGASQTGRAIAKWSKLAAAGIVGVGLVGAGARFFFHGSAQAPSPSAAPVVAERATTNESALPSAQPIVPAPLPSTPEPSPAKADTPRAPSSKSAAAPGVDTLADEVRIMSAARASLRQNAYAPTLANLDEYTARYPKGLFREEELAMRVLALCGLGRASEARRALESLERMAPKSRQLERARASCARADR
jgi:hypothetical protein